MTVLDDTRLHTLKQVAAWAQVSTRTVERAIATGELESLQVGSQRRVTDDAVRRWLKLDSRLPNEGARPHDR